MQDQGYDTEWFLDLETGEVVPRVGEDQVGEDATDKLIEENPDRFRAIESVPSHRSFKIMESFVSQLPASREKFRLEDVLEGRKPFRNFKDALSDMDPLRDEWFRFELESFAVIAQEWLEDEGIEADLIIRPPQD